MCFSFASVEKVIGHDTYDRGGIGLGIFGREPPRVDPGDVEQIVDVPQDGASVPLDDLEIPAKIRVQIGRRAQMPLEGSENQRQRRAELVADVGEEPRLELVLLFNFSATGA